MKYLSTRGGVDGSGFEDVLLEGLAPDGGLYLPVEWPSLSDGDDHLEYPQLVAEVLLPFVDPDPLAAELPALAAEAYADFGHPQVAPIRSVGEGLYLLELYWGPTLSFKDYALQLVGRLFDVVLTRRGRRMMVVGATSGDTGSAAIEACRGREAMDIIILYPAGRVSEMQRRQMTTVADSNVWAVEVKGTFDDCQAMVKAVLADEARRASLGLGAVNSINWARVAAQAAYYVWAAKQVGPASFVVPTGNFGNVFAGYVAGKMGAEINRLLIANNRNHGLHDLIQTGRLQVDRVQATVAPAMDIQIPSNLERYLFELHGRDPQEVVRLQAELASTGVLQLDPALHEQMAGQFASGWLADGDVLSVIRRVHQDYGLVLDPHTAIGWAVGEKLRAPGESLVIIATAHPAKFENVVKEAIGQPPLAAAALEGLMERTERRPVIAANVEALTSLLDRVAKDEVTA
jgi:threonine synthase